MKLVIDIDENTYNDIEKGKVYTSVRDVPQESVLAIANGTPFDDVLDKIRVEIESEKLEDSPNFCIKAHNDAVDRILQIIDKYRAESEG